MGFHGFFHGVDTATSTPVGPATEFGAGDSELYHCLDLVNVSNGDLIEWTFRASNGETIRSLSLAFRYGGTVSRPHVWIYKPVSAFAADPGTWRVTLSVNGHQVLEDSFAIAQPGATVATPSAAPEGVSSAPAQSVPATTATASPSSTPPS